MDALERVDTSAPDLGAPPLLAGLDMIAAANSLWAKPVSYTHLRAHETVLDLVCRLLLEKKKKKTTYKKKKQRKIIKQ